MGVTETDRKSLALTIGGQPRSSRAGETLTAVNPATGEEIASFPRGRAEDVEDAVAAAREALPDWRDGGAQARAAVVRDLADVIVEHAEELALLDVHENGSPIREMRRDAFAAAASLRY